MSGAGTTCRAFCRRVGIAELRFEFQHKFMPAVAQLESRRNTSLIIRLQPFSPRRAQPAPRLMLHVAADMEATLLPYGSWALNGFNSRFLHI